MSDAVCGTGSGGKRPIGSVYGRLRRLSVWAVLLLAGAALGAATGDDAVAWTVPVLIVAVLSGMGASWSP
ncbi:hypothetical protein [Actinocorallia sp. A-T 12471]|uniref:hypothetical protein n=1 Tax=Actinocorallia sp. A-T 12471 TaxID=3089813 RepID=UPI0029D3E40C|nr:hypothetical protein [Actinocorallia sp. A-T 12471]MDX6739545.1 hypothetical protein [Actinocorallia sp. A-T 12471]